MVTIDRISELRTLFNINVDNMDNTFDRFRTIIDNLTNSFVEHYVTYGELAFDNNILTNYFNSTEYLSSWNNLQQVVSQLNSIRDNIYAIVNEIEINFPNHLNSFEYEQIIL